MKKAYVTPDIVFESFEITENIAAGCTLINSHFAPYDCPVFDEEIGLAYFSQLGTCHLTPPGGNDSICYHVPVNDNNVYVS